MGKLQKSAVDQIFVLPTVYDYYMLKIYFSFINFNTKGKISDRDSKLDWIWGQKIRSGSKAWRLIGTSLLYMCRNPATHCFWPHMFFIWVSYLTQRNSTILLLCVNLQSKKTLLGTSEQSVHGKLCLNALLWKQDKIKSQMRENQHSCTVKSNIQVKFKKINVCINNRRVTVPLSWGNNCFIIKLNMKHM